MVASQHNTFFDFHIDKLSEQVQNDTNSTF